MPEFFDISLIAKRTYNSRNTLHDLVELEIFSNWKKEMHILDEQDLIISKIEDDEADFEEVVVSIRDLIFHKEFFDSELSEITRFIEGCFARNNNLSYALCSYELNGYLISNRKSIENFNNEFLENFPIVYKRIQNQFSVQINFNAQNIFD